MKELQLTIQIRSSKESVWAVLWNDETFRDWANIIDEGTYLVGEMKQGNEIQFISSVNGYGVTSLIEQLRPFEYVLFRHAADTQGKGIEDREKEWTGGKESYSLTEHHGITTLVLRTDVPAELVDIFETRLPLAMERIKQLAESRV